MSPKISIITGTYNSERYLANYFRMLEAQTFKDWETILVDDGSKDATVDLICAQSRKDARFRLLQKTPEGFPSRSRALGLEAALGEYVAFCDHDDFWAPQKLEMQMHLLKQFPDISILHTDRYVWARMEPPKEMFWFAEPISLIPWERQQPEQVIYQGLQIIFSSFVARRDLVKRVGFHPDMKGVDDFYLFVRLAQYGSISRINLPLTYYYAHQGNLSHQNNIFVQGFYKVAEVLENDPVPEKVKRSIRAQAYRTEAVSLFASDRRRSLQLLVKSLKTYYISSTITRLGFLLLTFLIPARQQTSLMKAVKRIKFMFPTLRDIYRR